MAAMPPGPTFKLTHVRRGTCAAVAASSQTVLLCDTSSFGELLLNGPLFSHHMPQAYAAALLTDPVDPPTTAGAEH